MVLYRRNLWVSKLVTFDENFSSRLPFEDKHMQFSFNQILCRNAYHQKKKKTNKKINVNFDVFKPNALASEPY